MLTATLFALAAIAAPHPPLRGTLSSLRGARVAASSTSALLPAPTGRRWPEGPDEGTPSSADCATCHEDVAKAFAFKPHATACATCHDVKPEHLEAPSKETVTRKPKDEACLSCHAAHKNVHTRQHVACVDCHRSGHAPNATSVSAACGGCHAAQRASFERPFAHRDGRVPMGCTECHAAHGEQTAASRSCAQCHADLAGPRVFEHRAQQVNGCLGCHESHGTTNARLLKRRDIASLCLECHTNAPQFHDITQTKFRACVTCHVAVHGSNRDAHLFDE